MYNLTLIDDVLIHTLPLQPAANSKGRISPMRAISSFDGDIYNKGVKQRD
jgi:hypothetical protein